MTTPPPDWIIGDQRKLRPLGRVTTRRRLLVAILAGVVVAAVLLVLADALDAPVLAAVAAVIVLGLLGLRALLLRTPG